MGEPTGPETPPPMDGQASLTQDPTTAQHASAAPHKVDIAVPPRAPEVSPPTDNSDLPESLLAAIKGVYSGFDARFIEIPHDWIDSTLSVGGKFFHVALNTGTPTDDELCLWLYHKIIPFCLPRHLRQEKELQYNQTHDPRYIHELTDQARSLFVRALKSTDSVGEIGELILFVLLEHVLRAPQIACKMHLKTNASVPVFGTDAIHVRYESSRDVLQVFWGESKLYAEASKALDDACSSIASFAIGSDNKPATRSRDITIIRDHLDIQDPELRVRLLDFFDPYSPASNRREEWFACFVAFDYSEYLKTGKTDPNGKFREEVRNRISSLCELFSKKIKENALQQQRFFLFLLPVPSVEHLRKKFLAHLKVES